MKIYERKFFTAGENKSLKEIFLDKDKRTMSRVKKNAKTKTHRCRILFIYAFYYSTSKSRGQGF